MLETGKCLKIVEEDDFNEGCLPNTTQYIEIDVTFKSATTENLIEQMKNYFDVETEDILINSCDEDGRIDIQTLENAEGRNATKYQVDLWRNGLIKLYACVYTCNVYEVTRNIVKL